MEDTRLEQALPGHHSRFYKIALFGLIILCIVALLGGGYFFYRWQTSPEVVQKRELDRIIKSVGALTVLPEGETPSLATVTNKSRLDNQYFFKKTENGDKILLYPHAGKAFLYRPENGKLVDMTSLSVAPLSSPEMSPSQESPSGKEDPLTVTLSIGTDTLTTFTKAEERLKAFQSSVRIVERSVAVSRHYDHTVVIDTTNTHADLAEQLAEALHGEVLLRPPAEENAPNTDILIIVGGRE